AFNPVGRTTLPDYLRSVYQLDRLLLNLRTRGDLEGLRSWVGGLGAKVFFSRIGATFAVPLVRFAMHVNVRRGFQYAYMFRRANSENLSQLRLWKNAPSARQVLRSAIGNAWQQMWRG